MATKVTDIVISPVRYKKDGLIALATCVIDGKFFIGSLGLYQNKSGKYYITYPTKTLKKSKLQIFAPTNNEVKKSIEDAITDEYLDLITKDV